MASILRKRMRAAEHTSPDYEFISMALSYHRPSPAMMQERAPRMSLPSQRAREAATGGPQALRPTRRVQFAPSPPLVAPEVAPAIPLPADPQTSFVAAATYQDVPGVPEKYSFRERLPQSFPHGLPPSSLEPGATDQQYPPSSLFPEPPVRDGPELLMEPPLQAMAHLQDAPLNLTQLVGELAATMWRKATDQERHFPQLHVEEEPELAPAILARDRRHVHSTPVYLTNSERVFDVEGFVPKECVIDTGASKAMCSKRFAAAMGIGQSL